MMTLRSGSRTYERRRFLGGRAGPGVDVTIHEVHREVQSRLTAERLQRYLGEELRDRIRRQGVTIVLEDRLPPSKKLEVRPAVFRGERIAGIGEIPVADHPPVRAEIYLAPETLPGTERPAVALYRLGTRVCQDIAGLPEFAREPWSSGRLEGALDYADFRVAPASREGFTPDAAYSAFVEAVLVVEPILLERLRREDESRAEQAGRSLVRELQSAFARLLKDLPAGDYDWFGADGRRPFAGGGEGRPGGPDAVPGGGAIPDGAEEGSERAEAPREGGGATTRAAFDATSEDEEPEASRFSNRPCSLDRSSASSSGPRSRGSQSGDGAGWRPSRSMPRASSSRAGPRRGSTGIWSTPGRYRPAWPRSSSSPAAGRSSRLEADRDAPR